MQVSFTKSTDGQTDWRQTKTLVTVDLTHMKMRQWRKAALWDRNAALAHNLHSFIDWTIQSKTYFSSEW